MSARICSAAVMDRWISARALRRSGSPASVVCNKRNQASTGIVNIAPSARDRSCRRSPAARASSAARSASGVGLNVGSCARIVGSSRGAIST